MHKGPPGSRIVISTVLLLGLLLSNSAFAQAERKPANELGSMGPAPKAQCGPFDWTESGLQGQTTSGTRERRLGRRLQLQSRARRPVPRRGSLFAGRAGIL